MLFLHHLPWCPPTLNILTCVHAQLLPLCPTLCDPMDCSPPGSSFHGFLQARILEWVAVPFSRGSSRPRDQTHVSYVSCIGRWILYHWAIGQLLNTCNVVFLGFPQPLTLSKTLILSVMIFSNQCAFWKFNSNIR